MNWTQFNLPGSLTTFDLTYHNNQWFLAAINDGLGSNRLYRSSNGQTWQDLNISYVGSWRSVAKNGSTTVLIGDGVLPNFGGIYSNNNELTWNPINNFPTNFSPRVVKYCYNKFICLGAGTKGAISTDGANWSEITVPNSLDSYDSIAVGVLTNNTRRFIAVGAGVGTSSNKYIFSTNDGATWSEGTFPLSRPWNGAIYKGGLFIVLGAYSDKGLRSTDGQNWTEFTLPFTATWRIVDWTPNGGWVAISYNGPGNAGTPTNFAQSTDGQNWSLLPLPVPQEGSLMASDDNSRYVMLPFNGSNGLLLTANVSSSSSSSSSSSLIEVGLATGNFCRQDLPPPEAIRIAYSTCPNVFQLGCRLYSNSNGTTLLPNGSYTNMGVSHTLTTLNGDVIFTGFCVPFSSSSSSSSSSIFYTFSQNIISALTPQGTNNFSISVSNNIFSGFSLNTANNSNGTALFSVTQTGRLYYDLQASSEAVYDVFSLERRKNGSSEYKIVEQIYGTYGSTGNFYVEPGDFIRLSYSKDATDWALIPNNSDKAFINKLYVVGGSYVRPDFPPKAVYITFPESPSLSDGFDPNNNSSNNFYTFYQNLIPALTLLSNSNFVLNTDPDGFIASGAGMLGFDGIYIKSGLRYGKPVYVKENQPIFKLKYGGNDENFFINEWVIAPDGEPDNFYYLPQNLEANQLSTGGWLTTGPGAGTPPPPILTPFKDGRTGNGANHIFKGYSTNKSNNSSGVAYLRSNVTGRLYYKLSASSQVVYDVFYLERKKHNLSNYNIIDELYGLNKSSGNFYIEPNDIIRLVYNKNETVSSNNDEGVLDSLYVVGGSYVRPDFPPQAVYINFSDNATLSEIPSSSSSSSSITPSSSSSSSSITPPSSSSSSSSSTTPGGCLPPCNPEFIRTYQGGAEGLCITVYPSSSSSSSSSSSICPYDGYMVYLGNENAVRDDNINILLNNQIIGSYIDSLPSNCNGSCGVSGELCNCPPNITCPSGLVVDPASCICVPPCSGSGCNPCSGTGCDPGEPVLVDCSGVSLTIEGYAFYRDNPGTSCPTPYGSFNAKCGGGHVCNRTDFLPTLRVTSPTGNAEYPATAQITLNNLPAGGPRDGTFTINIPDSLSLSGASTSFELVCKSPANNCHNGVTYVVMFMKVGSDAIKIFDDCIAPSTLQDLPLVCSGDNGICTGRFSGSLYCTGSSSSSSSSSLSSLNVNQSLRDYFLQQM